MRLRAWQLPWKDRWVPHGLLDIIRGCNLSCRACYNMAGAHTKSIDDICRELEVFHQNRKLDSLGIVGGEPLLHPQLTDIIRRIKAAGVNVELFTNGLLLDEQRLASLKSAGADMIFLHIDAHQDRPDLPTPGIHALRALQAAKAAAIAAAGMEAGLAITAYPDAIEEIDSAVEFVLASPHLDYLLVTLCRDVQGMGRLVGDLRTGITGAPGSAASCEQTLNNEFIFGHMRDRFGLLPFAYLGSNVDDNDPRWLTYVIASIVRDGHPPTWSMLRASGTERMYLHLFRWLNGRYPFYLRQSPRLFRVQLLLSAFTGGRLAGNLAVLGRSLGRHRVLKTKRILFQCPAQLGTDGRLIHCSHCPDATVRHGRLMPVCISDQVAGEKL